MVISLSNNNNKYFLKPQLSQDSQPKNTLTKNQKLGIRLSTAAGILGSLAILAKTSKTPYSLKISKMVSTPFKDSFLGKIDYDVKNVLVVGGGSCLGGLIGGLLFDKNKNNRQAKLREGLVQYTNIALPIATVHYMSKLGEFCAKKMSKGGNFLNAIAPILGLGVGIVVGNRISNKLNQLIFHKKDNRPVELTDMSAHLDDICMTSQYIVKDNILTKSASRFIPLALMVAGCEIGKKQEKTN